MYLMIVSLVTYCDIITGIQKLYQNTMNISLLTGNNCKYATKYHPKAQETIDDIYVNSRDYQCPHHPNTPLSTLFVILVKTRLSKDSVPHLAQL